MHSRFKILIIFLLSLIAINSCKNNNKDSSINTEADITITEKTKKPILELFWQTDSVLKTPESALFDNTRNVIYVSNVNLNPREKDGNGFISKLAKDGSIIELEWVKDMSSPKGLGLFGNILYVTDVDEIITIDVDSGTILKKYPVANSGMLNDISIDTDGTVYFTDMDAGKILTLKDESISLWKSEVNLPNGIFIEDKRVLIASKDNKFMSFNKETKDVLELCEGIGNGDGIEIMNSGSYLVSDWAGELFLIKNNVPTSILSLKENNIQTADIGLIKNENIVLIPTFFNNRLMAYKVNE